MPLLKDGVLVTDKWVSLVDGDALPMDQPVIVGLDRWQAEREALLGRNTPLGLRLKSDQSPEAVEDDLDRFDVIALEFPRFGDGRAFTYARMLRERYAFRGEVRAVGDVLVDQFAFMTRVGFDAFELPDGADPKDYLAALERITVAYQSAMDGRRRVADLRRDGP